MNYNEALKVVKTISIYYQNFVITEERVKEWALEIQEYELEQVMNNLKSYVKTNKFPPTLADLIKFEEPLKQLAYLLNTVDSMKEQALQAAELLRQIDEPKRFSKINISEESRLQLNELMKKLREEGE